MALSLISKTLFRQSIQIYGEMTGSFPGSAKKGRTRKVSARESKRCMRREGGRMPERKK